MTLIAKYWPFFLAGFLVLIAIGAGIVIWANKDAAASEPPEPELRRPVRKFLKPSYDGRAAHAGNVFSLDVRRDELAQIDVQAASHALIDMGRGQRRPNPYEAGPHDKCMRWHLAYLQAFVERDHAIADSQARATT